MSEERRSVDWQDVDSIAEPQSKTETYRIFKSHFSAGPAGTQPPWDTPAAMWRVVFSPRHRWVSR